MTLKREYICLLSHILNLRCSWMDTPCSDVQEAGVVGGDVKPVFARGPGKAVFCS